MKLPKTIRKALRSRGFGVHSPFAYRFITFVLRNSSSYYGYSNLRQMSESRREFKELAVIFRMVCDLRPDIVYICGDNREIERAVVKRADSRVPVAELLSLHSHTGMAPDMPRLDSGTGLFPLLLLSEREYEHTNAMPLQGGGEWLKTARRILENEGIIVLRGEALRYAKELRDAMRHGMSFTNGHLTVIVSRHDLPVDHFDLWF